MTKRIKGKTDKGRILITAKEEEPKSARRNKDCYHLWLCAKELKLDEIEMLVTKRKQDLRYEKDPNRIRELRTQILILEDTHKIVRRKIKEEDD